MELNLYKHSFRTLIPIFALTFLGLIPMYLFSDIVIEDEICDNAIDDDLDGLIDLNDPDCECNVAELESLIPNPSFEETECCPEGPNQLDCASGWIQASFPTTDFINMCGWMGWNGGLDNGDNFPPPQPFPDGEGIVGFRDGVSIPAGMEPLPTSVFMPNWKEYAGACLLSPMEADSSYRIEFDIGFVNSEASPPIDVTFFGTTDCAYLPFGGNNIDSLIGCPTNGSGWVKLGSVFVSGGIGDRWVNAAIEVTPDEDILAIAIGPSCSSTVQDKSLYYYLDNLLLDETKSFQLEITNISNPCAEDFALQVEDYPGLSYQWYKDGIALVGEITAQLTQMYGEGDYQVRIDDGTICTLSGKRNFTIPILSTPVYQIICEGEVFLFGNQELGEAGIYTDTLQSINNCDSVIILELEITGTVIDTMNAMIFEGESFEIENYSFNQAGDYEIMVTSQNRCDELVLLHLEYYHIFIPNVFSPNYDGINDFFTVLAENGLIQNIDLTIFNRWGSTVYKGSEWDGRHNNEFVNPGVYVYLIKVRLNDNASHQFSGSVTVLR